MKKPAPRKKAAKPKAKAGRSATASAERRRLFVARYQVNGHNATEAAIFAGCAPSNAKRQGWAMLHEPAVAQQLEAQARHVAEAAEMNLENWARQLRAIAFLDPADFFDADGKLLQVADMPPRVRAGLASIEVKSKRLKVADGEPAEFLTTTKVKAWDKVQALITMARHLGLFEKDNSQTKENIRVEVVLVG